MKPADTSLIFLLLASISSILPFPKVEAAELISNPDAYLDLALSGDSVTLRPTGAMSGGGAKGKKVSGASDKKARVYDVMGNARIAKKDVKEWSAITPGTMIEEGDIILTDMGSFISITFDYEYLNVSHIPANTRAEFRSIEPIDIYLEDGTIYNIFDNIPEGEQWRTSTPTAVAAVRGTWWLVNFISATGEFSSGTLQVADDGDDSIVNILDILEDGSEGGSIEIPENFQLDLLGNEKLNPSAVHPLDSGWLEKIWDFLEKLASLRAARSSLLPPTAGEFSPEPINPVQEGLAGPIVPQLDPELDIKNTPPLPSSSSSESSSSDEDFGNRSLEDSFDECEGSSCNSSNQ
ncbi:MAG: hypothetical protein HYZ85_03690 [Candidatus Omnitrophica bacterium]|nr:hypothetical protein [Candidatus Omnitrophota bacterium]